ncbi:RNA 2',3'-cyclic phosphodiesterase [Mangrovitalea sediminis]|uniref:RNA 2',3'-cyclic phosphodiesterase n=1 Tax=Mangrovitalea sediminis TaxID=1982043 RepID=UPI000BE4C908|nr:RNA 2',3'-cyclic phosphodiesterase [Mangrovitalea sediminis]
MTKSDPASEDTVRCFLAFPVPQTVQQELETELRRSWKGLARHYRQIPTVNWHLTVHFLDQQSRALVESLYTPIDELIRHQPPGESISLTRLGAFPDEAHPRFWVAEGKSPDSLSCWQQKLGELLIQHGIQPDTRRWRPHVSLARQKGLERGEPVNEVGIDCRLPIQQLQLLISTLTPTGSHYQALKEWCW